MPGRIYEAPRRHGPGRVGDLRCRPREPLHRSGDVFADPELAGQLLHQAARKARTGRIVDDRATTGARVAATPAARGRRGFSLTAERDEHVVVRSRERTRPTSSLPCDKEAPPRELQRSMACVSRTGRGRRRTRAGAASVSLFTGGVEGNPAPASRLADPSWREPPWDLPSRSGAGGRLGGSAEPTDPIPARASWREPCRSRPVMTPPVTAHGPRAADRRCASRSMHLTTRDLHRHDPDPVEVVMGHPRRDGEPPLALGRRVDRLGDLPRRALHDDAAG